MRGALPLGLRPHPAVFLTRRSLALAVGLLAGCAGAGDGFAELDHPAPLTVLSNLPFGITPSDVRVRDGCYYYQDGGAVVPISTPQMRAQGLTGPYCVG